MSRPNVLYVHSHDTGRYVQPYGHAIPTPNLQRFAEQGVLFRQAFCAGPTCSASRAALLTGLWPHQSGMIGLAHRGFSLSDYDRHLAAVLKANGYTTALSNFEHEGVRRHRPDLYDVDLGVTEAPEAAAAAWLRDGPNRPFFLSVGFVHTHRAGITFQGAGEWSMDAETTLEAAHLLPPAPLPETPVTRKDMALFADSAIELDRRMGVVFDALDAAGLAEETLVICTTDHGIAFPLMKCNLTDHGLGVMLLMRGPGGFEGGRCLDAMVSHVDVFPTVCELAGIERPSWLVGESLLPAVRGEVEELHEAIYGEVTYHAAYEPQRCVRTRRWKYIRRFEPRDTPVLTNVDDSPSKDQMLAAGWGRIAPADEQLYDLMLDPNEAHNLVGEPRCADVLAGMRSRLDAYMRQTDDPLLDGPVPAPPGASVNDPDGLSPQEPLDTV